MSDSQLFVLLKKITPKIVKDFLRRAKVISKASAVQQIGLKPSDTVSEKLQVLEKLLVRSRIQVNDKAKIYAHRGGAGYHVENTLSAFEFAIELGCAGAELDVQLTKDSQVVVHHNDRLNHHYTRKANGQWLSKDEEYKINELTLAELRQYTIGEPNPHTNYRKKFSKLLPVENQTIPTLQEVIQLARQKSDTFKLLIEIKTDIFSENSEAWLPLVEAVLDLVEREAFTNRAEYCSFDWRSLIEIKKQKPTAKTWFTTHPHDWLTDSGDQTLTLNCSEEYLNKLRTSFATGDTPWYAGYQPKAYKDFPQAIKQAGGDVWFAYWKSLSTEQISQAQSQKLEIGVWTSNLNNSEDYKNINILDVDFQCVDYPNYRFFEVSPENQKALDIADIVRKRKKWKEAKFLYEKIHEVLGEETPVEAYWKLAVVYRILKDYKSSEDVIENGFRVFPYNVSLFVELSALYNAKHEWGKAANLWSKTFGLLKNVSELNYIRASDAYFYSCNFDRFLDICLKGVSNYPQRVSIEARFYHSLALHFYRIENYKRVLDLTRAIEKREVKPFSVDYLKRQSKIYCDNISFDEISYGLFFNNAIFDYRSFLGLEQMFHNAFVNSSHPDVWEQARRGISPVLSYIITTNKVLNHDKSPVLISAIDELSGLYSEALEAELLPVKMWFLISNLFIINQRFDLYYSAREKALRSARLSNFVSPRDKKFKIQALLEDGFFAEVDKLQLVDENVRKYKKKKSDIEYLFNLDLYSPAELFDPSSTLRDELSNDDIEFSGYIKNKRIALVGPVDVGVENGFEIDSYDVVIRFNYKGLLGYSEEIFGSKTNVSYYIKMDLPSDSSSPDKVDSMNELDWVVADFNHNKTDKCFEGVRSRIRNRYKAGHDFANPFFKGTPNGVQRAILDLLRFQPSEIKVFNSNLFISNDYVSTYRSGSHAQVRSFNFTRHDPISNFVFLQRLYKNKKISVDSALHDILRLSKKNYVDALQKRYGRG